MSSALRVLVAITVSLSVSLALNSAIGLAGVNTGTAAHPRVHALAAIFAANIAMAGLAGYLCAWLAGGRRVLPATAGLMLAYLLLGLRTGRQLVAAGEPPFSSAIVTLLCVSVMPIGAALFVNRGTRTTPRGR
jgi:hypothetical protein